MVWDLDGDGDYVDVWLRARSGEAGILSQVLPSGGESIVFGEGVDGVLVGGGRGS
jgi:hypothetical protein